VAYSWATNGSLTVAVLSVLGDTSNPTSRVRFNTFELGGELPSEAVRVTG